MVQDRQYVTLDDHGVMRVGANRVMLDGIAWGYMDGYSAETIQQMYPSATVEEVYGAIAFYLANKAEVDAYLKGQEETFDRLRAESLRHPSPVVQRLRDVAASRAKERV